MSKIVLCVDDSATMQQVADITFRGTEFTYVGARTIVEFHERAEVGVQTPAGYSEGTPHGSIRL